ncbi:MAG TPA: glycosyltransferase [Candidatus Marinimicrobia bacterium]|nr:glycosyltransferase [Candidatus Neomarinimicrobiota bacterium]
MNDLPHISALIPSYQRAHLLMQTLKSVQACNYPPGKFQIIIVNDASTDETHELCSKLKEIIYLRHDKNRGRAETRNTGLAAATGDIIFFIDDDQVLPPHYFLAHIASYQANPRCVATVGQYRTPAPYRDAWGIYLENRGPVRFSINKPLSAKYFQGGNVSVRKIIIDKCGGFDPLFDKYGGEDADLGQRIRQYGEICFCSDGYSYHHGIPSLEKQLLRLEDFGRDGLKKLMQKHPALESEYRIGLFKKPWSFIWNGLIFRFCRSTYKIWPQWVANFCFSYMIAYRVFIGYKESLKKS